MGGTWAPNPTNPTQVFFFFLNFFNKKINKKINKNFNCVLPPTFQLNKSRQKCKKQNQE